MEEKIKKFGNFNYFLILISRIEKQMFAYRNARLSVDGETCRLSDLNFANFCEFHNKIINLKSAMEGIKVDQKVDEIFDLREEEITNFDTLKNTMEKCLNASEKALENLKKVKEILKNG